MHRQVLTALLVFFVLTGTAYGADSSWPDQMTIAGFSVTGIRGSVNPNGSGAARGTLVIPGVAGVPVSLTRSANGDVSAVCTVNLRVDGAEVEGNGRLNSSGLRIDGSVQGSVKPVYDAVLSVDPSGSFQGKGRIVLNSLSVPVTVSITTSSLTIRGSVSVESQCDMQLASYRFTGTLAAEGGAGRLVLTASGKVERKGKLADQVSTHSVRGLPVNLSDGTGAADVGGVNVRFNFF